MREHRKLTGLTYESAFGKLKAPCHWAYCMGREDGESLFISYPQAFPNFDKIRPTGRAMTDHLTKEDHEAKDWWVSGFAWPDEGDGL